MASAPNIQVTVGFDDETKALLRDLLGKTGEQVHAEAMSAARRLVEHKTSAEAAEG